MRSFFTPIKPKTRGYGVVSLKHYEVDRLWESEGFMPGGQEESKPTKSLRLPFLYCLSTWHSSQTYFWEPSEVGENQYVRGIFQQHRQTSRNVMTKEKENRQKLFSSSQTIGLAIAILGKEDWYQAYHNPIGMQIKLLWKSHGLFWHFQRVKEQTKKPIRNDE